MQRNWEKLSIPMFLAVSLSLTLGIYFRLKGLGNWPLAVDEYFIAQSIKNIIAHGLPQFDSGGFYERGLLFQYLDAPFFLLFTNKEFALRFINIFFFLLAIPPIYQLGNKASGRAGAGIAIIIFCLSLWEIELSRFGRMYCMFQTFFLWYLYFLFKYYIDKQITAKYWMYAISLASVLAHEAGIFLVALNFLPFLNSKIKKNLIDYLITTLLLVIVIIFLHIDFRHMGLGPYLPDNLQAVERIREQGPIFPQIFLFNYLSNDLFNIILLLIPLTITLYVIYKTIKDNSIKANTKIWFTFLLILSACNLFGLLAISIILIQLLNISVLNGTKVKDYRPLLFSIGFNLIFWLFYSILNREWFFLIKYPASPIVNQAILPWLKHVPFLLITISIPIAIGLVTCFTNKNNKDYHLPFLFSILIILTIFVGIIKTHYFTTRYTFFLYPLIIITAIGSLKKLFELFPTSKLVYLLVCAMFASYLSSEDINLYHFLNIDKPEVNYRIIYNRGISDHFYDRLDVKTPADQININLRANDIVISTLPSMDYYLKKQDYYYVNYKNYEFRGLSTNSGTSYLWYNSKLIYDEKNLMDIIHQQSGHAYLIAYSNNGKYHNSTSTFIFEKYNKKLFYTSIDGNINVYRI